MIIGEFLMAFFAVWTVHHDTHESPELARTQSEVVGKIKLLLVCSII
jgi:hypothetical protein